MIVSRWRLAASLVLALTCAAPAQAGVRHTVAPGETLWSIAAASNLTTRTLAAANGLPEDAPVVIGNTITVPSVSEGAAALGGNGATSGSSTAPAPPRPPAPTRCARATPSRASPPAPASLPGRWPP